MNPYFVGQSSFACLWRKHLLRKITLSLTLVKIAQIVAVESEKRATKGFESLDPCTTYIHFPCECYLFPTYDQIYIYLSPISRNCTNLAGTLRHKHSLREVRSFPKSSKSSFYVPRYNKLTCHQLGLRQLVGAALKYQIMKGGTQKLGLTKYHLVFAEKCHKMSGSIIIFGVLRFQTMNTLFRWQIRICDWLWPLSYNFCQSLLPVECFGVLAQRW